MMRMSRVYNHLRFLTQSLFSLHFCLISSMAFSQTSIEGIMEDYEISPKYLSILLEEVETNNSVINHNSNIARSPGSVTKLFTAFTALDILGEKYRWITRAYVRGYISDQKIKHLLIRGGGDSTFSVNDLQALITDIRLKGVREIQSGLLLDQSFFSQRRKSTGIFAESPLRPYNTMHSSLIVNSNKLDFKFNYDLKRNRVEIITDFLPSNIKIQNKLIIGSGSCSDFGSQVEFEEIFNNEMLTINIEGIFPKDCLFFEHDIAITESEHYFFGVFKKLWLESGGSINGTFKAKHLAKSDEPIARSISEPLIIVLTEMLKESNNLIARNVFLSLPIDSKRKNYRKARRKVSQSMSNNSISWKRVNTIENGSGLSRKTRIKPESIMSLVRKINQDESYSDIQLMLPISGLDGTLENSYRSELLKGRLRLKTGTLNGVKGLSGFITSLSGKEYRFVFIHNNFDDYKYDLSSFMNELLSSIVSDDLITYDE